MEKKVELPVEFISGAYSSEFWDELNSCETISLETMANAIDVLKALYEAGKHRQALMLFEVLHDFLSLELPEALFEYCHSDANCRNYVGTLISDLEEIYDEELCELSGGQNEEE